MEPPFSLSSDHILIEPSPPPADEHLITIDRSTGATGEQHTICVSVVRILYNVLFVDF